MSGIGFSTCPITVAASGTVNAYRFVGTDKAQCGAGANAFGVSMHSATDEDMTIETIGPVKVEAGAAVTEGGLVESDASGRAIDRTAGAIVGRALEGATAAGEFILVSLIRN